MLKSVYTTAPPQLSAAPPDGVVRALLHLVAGKPIRTSQDPRYLTSQLAGENKVVCVQRVDDSGRTSIVWVRTASILWIEAA